MNYRFQSFFKAPSRQISMSRKENVIMRMVLLGITGHGCVLFCCFGLGFLFGWFFWFVCLFGFVLGFFFLDICLSLSSLLSLAAFWAEEALRSLLQLLKQEGAWL